MDPDDRIKLIHTLDDLIAAGVQNDGFFLSFERLPDIGDRDREDGFSDRNLHTIYDRERKRDLQSGTASFSKLAGDGNDAADRFYVLLHNIHADSTTGELGNFLVGRKTGNHQKR